MWRTSLLALTVGSFLALDASWKPVSRAQDPDPPTRAKLEAVQKQLKALQQQMEDLRRQERALQQKLEEETYYVKVEIKGRLERRFDAGRSIETWEVTVPFRAFGVPPSSTAFVLNWAGDRTAFLGWAKENKGKTVLVTGRLRVISRWKEAPATNRGGIPLPPEMTVEVAKYASVAD